LIQSSLKSEVLKKVVKGKNPCCKGLWSSNKGRTVDALALEGDEGRG
jgi:hypothetical protein